MSPYNAAQSVIYCAVSDEIAGLSGRYFERCSLAKDCSFSSDVALCEKLWRVSELLVGCVENGTITVDPLLYNDSKIDVTEDIILCCSMEEKKVETDQKLEEKLIILRS